LHARLDPLDLHQHPPHAELDPHTYGFTDEDMDRVVDTCNLAGMPDEAPLRDVVAFCEETYCQTLGLEFMHISTPAKKRWLFERMETISHSPIDSEVRLSMLDKLIAAEALEGFIHTKYPGTKRFSIEGAETLVPMLEEVIETSVAHGAIEIVLGMAHRGRLNVMVQTMGQPARDLFAQFDDVEPEKTLGGGDVKYHLGASVDRVARNGETVHLSLAFNPSHLEAVNPVVVGRVRAKQRRHDDWQRRKIAGVLIHGDAAFAGQGLVPETSQLSNLHGYRTGGTVHLIVNNQIGFTATAQESRSTPYCTDVAKMIQCPIFHVNGEDPDSVARAVQLAAEYRAHFQSDVVVDMFCYRRYGHNEMDEPGFTNPIMYKAIQSRSTIAALYGKRLMAEGVLTSAELEERRRSWKDHYEAELSASRELRRRPDIPAMGGVWQGYLGGSEAEVQEVDTGISLERIEELSQALTSVPPEVNAHRKVKALLAGRAKMGRGEKPIDWGMAELLAYSSLLREGTPVRLSGQDSSRGTFSHRHAIIVDVETGTEHMLLGNLHPEQADCRIYDSPLSEAGVLGFEFGYSLDFPDGLVMWEAQFGDFANGAQVILDQFITSSEDKWNRLSGLVLLLPHGYEGQGPEHSSARIERYLQACAEDNIRVAQPSTPAQMFHLIRRQVKSRYRKPLVVATPKSLLRLPAATSTRDELASQTRFQRFLDDPAPPPAAKVQRIFLCSGRVFYDLLAERQKRGDASTAILRVEQYYPWRADELERLVDGYSEAIELVWVQDEPGNMGAASFMLPRLLKLAGERRIRVVTRPDSASPATGSSKAHLLEQEALLAEAFAPLENRRE
jgi:2-oxoglutarate dehydrogenase E1 component